MPFVCSKCSTSFNTRAKFIKHIGSIEPCWNLSEADIKINIPVLYDKAQEIINSLNVMSQITEKNYPIFASGHQRLKCSIIPQIRAGIRILPKDQYDDSMQEDLESLIGQNRIFNKMLIDYRRKKSTKANELEFHKEPDNNDSPNYEESGP